MSIENLTIIIPFKDGNSTIDRLLDSLPRELPVRVIDDLSDTPYQTARENVKVTRRETRGYFSGAVNEGIRQEQTHSLLILNQDVYFYNDSFFKLIQDRRNEFAMIGGGVFGHPAFTRGYVEGQAMFLRGDAIERVGLLNEKDFPLWGATAEYQTRLCRAGFKALPIRAADYGMRHERGEKPYGTSIAATLASEPDKQKLFVRTPPLISVIITCYNYGRFLRDAVNSLIGGQTALGEMPLQTFQAFEIVIVDDASTDDTRAIGESLADPWQGIHFVHLPQNVGSAAAANAGILRSHGKWIAMLDADDMMDTTRLETLYRTAEQNPHRVIYDDTLEFAKDALTLKNAHPQADHSEIKARGTQFTIPFRMRDYDFERTLQQNGMHKGLLFERAAWQEIGGYPEEFTNGREDWAINVGLGAKGYCGVRVPQSLYLRRHHGANRHLENGSRDWRTKFIAQMHARYPNLYAGDRPTMCCGNKSKTNGNGNGNNARSMGVLSMSAFNGRFAMSKTNMPGQGGFVLVEYLPHKSGGSSFIGAVTGAAYVFGGKRKTGYVDPRDLDALLKARDGIHDAFRVITPAPQLQTLSVTETETPAPTPDELPSHQEIVNQEYISQDLFNPAPPTVESNVVDWRDNADAAQLNTANAVTSAKPKTPRKPATPKAAKTAKAKK